jgi:hypothetical protein
MWRDPILSYAPHERAGVTPRAPLAAGGPWLAIGLSGLVALTAYVACLGRGYFGDEGSYCTIAQGIVRGGLPYRDYFNEKPPLHYFLTAAMMAVTHTTFAAARILPAICLALTTLWVLLAAWRAGAQRFAVAAWAGVALLMAFSFAAFNNTAEAPLAMIYAGATLLVLGSGLPARRPIATALFLGWMFGVACGFRQTALLPAFVLLFAPELAGARRYYALGVLLGIVSWVGPVFSLGVGQGFINAAILFYANKTGLSKYTHGLREHSAAGAFLWLLGLGLLAGLREDWRRKLWLACWILAIAAPFYGRFDAFRLWPAVAAMLVVLALRLPRQTELLRMAAIAVAGLAGGLLVILHPARDSDAAAMAQLIDARTTAHETIWIAPYSPVYYCLTDRAPASRYYFLLPWTSRNDVRRTILSDLNRVKPKLIIDILEDDEKLGAIFPEIVPVLARDYHLDQTAFDSLIYVRNDVGGSAGDGR